MKSLHRVDNPYLRTLSPPQAVKRSHPFPTPGVQLKATTSFRLETRPAPPVYRAPNPPKVMQRKVSPNTFRMETRPAPPVFNPMAKVPLQRTISGAPKSHLPARNSKTVSLPRSSAGKPGVVSNAGPASRRSEPVIQPACEAIKSCFEGVYNCLTSCKSNNTDEDSPSQPLVPVSASATRTTSSVSSSRVNKSVEVGQGDYEVLKEGKKYNFGLITNCSAVLAVNDDGAAVVYHWPFTQWNQAYIEKMTEALTKIGCKPLDGQFSIMVYRMAYNGAAEDFREEMEQFKSRLKTIFTRKADYIIYKNGHMLEMDAAGKVNL